MANTILVIGESGTGKSSSIRNLNPKETFVIKVIDKKLPFRGSDSKYSTKKEDDKKINCMLCQNHHEIIKYINAVSERRPEVNTLIIDDLQYIMAFEYMDRMGDKNYKVFGDIGIQIRSIFTALKSAREDLDCFILTHSEKEEDGTYKMKTVGKMVDNYINPLGLCETVFHTLVKDGKYMFVTNNDNIRPCKSPMGMFDKMIDNDLVFIKQQFKEYF